MTSKFITTNEVNTQERSIAIATPFARNDDLLNILQQKTSYQLNRIKTREELSLQNLELLNPDWIFFPHWSWIIPKEILSKYKCVIFHMTDVPFGRGGSPLQNLIVRGHKKTMLTALQCVEKLDAGPVYLKVPLDLSGTAEEILLRASNLMPDMIHEIVSKDINPTPQVGDAVTVSRRKPSDGNISNLDSVSKIYDYIRMLDADGYPPAFLETKSLLFEFKEATQVDELYIEARVRIKVKP